MVQIDEQPLARDDGSPQGEVGDELLEGLALQQGFGVAQHQVGGVGVEEIAEDQPALILSLHQMAQGDGLAHQLDGAEGVVEGVGGGEAREGMVVLHLEAQVDGVAQGGGQFAQRHRVGIVDEAVADLGCGEGGIEIGPARAGQVSFHPPVGAALLPQEVVLYRIGQGEGALAG